MDGEKITEINNEDMYKSIGMSVTGKNKRQKSKDLSRSSLKKKLDEAVDKVQEGHEGEEGGTDDMMLSGWGADVFEMVDETEGVGSDSDDGSDDDDDVDVDSSSAPPTLQKEKSDRKSGRKEIAKSVGSFEKEFIDNAVRATQRRSSGSVDGTVTATSSTANSRRGSANSFAPIQAAVTGVYMYMNVLMRILFFLCIYM
jgi:hypothetical protein